MIDDDHEHVEKPKGIVLVKRPSWNTDDAKESGVQRPKRSTSSVSLHQYEGAPVYRLELDGSLCTIEDIAASFSRGLKVVDDDAEAKLLLLVVDEFPSLDRVPEQHHLLEMARRLAACEVPVLTVVTGDVCTWGLTLVLCSDAVYVSDTASISFDASEIADALPPEPLEALLTSWFGAKAADAWMTDGYRGSGSTLRLRGVEVRPVMDLMRAVDAIVEAIVGCELDAIRLLRNHLGKGVRACLEGNTRALVARGLAPDALPFRLEESDEVGFEPLSFESSVVSLSRDARGVVLVSMHDRTSKNAFSAALATDLARAFELIAARDDFKVVVLTGYDQYFASGGTKEALHDIQAGRTTYSDHPIYDLPLRCPLPVVAAMQGHGIGVGWTLGLYCDVPLFSEESVYTCSMMKYGFTPGAGSTFILPMRMGDCLGREAQYTAREYRGRELRDRGIGLPVVPRNRVRALAIGIAAELCESTREQLVAAKANWAPTLLAHLETVHALELDLHEKTFRGNPAVLSRIEVSYGRHWTAGGEQPSSGVTGAESARSSQDELETSASDRSKLSQELGEDWSVHERVRRGQADPCDRLRTILAEELYLNVEDVDEDSDFNDLGIDSIIGVTWIRRINVEFRLSIAATEIYNHPTLRSFADFVRAAIEEVEPRAVETSREWATDRPSTNERIAVDSEQTRQSSSWDESVSVEPAGDVGPRGRDEPNPAIAGSQRPPASTPGSDLGDRERFSSASGHALRTTKRPSELPTIAIIGMSGRFPKARTLDELWQVVRDGRDCIETVPSERWLIEDYFDATPMVPGKTYCRWMGCVDDADRFDSLFFNLAPSDAAVMDPQQRLFLEHAWACFEDGCHTPDRLSGSRCGVFVGCSGSDYGYEHGGQRTEFQSLMGGSTAILAARIAFHLNLKGPCMSIDTACSSSLVAISQACNSLVLGDCDVALAGGVTTLIGPTMHMLTSQAGMLSKDGRCFTFDDRANGFVPSEGIGVLLLKRLSDAERDGDPIYGTLRGWGVNHDGKTNGMTAPSRDAQARLEREVYERSGVDPSEIQLVEAHGTGTKLGDPIEVEALIESFRYFTDASNFCALGSIKSNIGHTIAASGVAGVMKVLMAIRHATLPPTLHVEKPNEHLQLDGSPFYINTQSRDWRVADGSSRKAAVSSFGLSGTNAHVVVEEYRTPRRQSQAQAEFEPAPFVLSAKSKGRLVAYAQSVLAFLEQRSDAGHESVDLLSLAHTYRIGRATFDARLGIVCRTLEELKTALRAFVADEAASKGVWWRWAKRRALNDVAAFEASSRQADLALSQGEYAEALRLWVQGADLDWNKIKRNSGRAQPSLVHAPTYPFSRERHWRTAVSNPSTADALRSSPDAGYSQLLVQRDVSTASDLRYQSTFTGAEPFLADHVVRGQKVLPGSAYLQMIALAAAKLRTRRRAALDGIIISDVVWLQPFVADTGSRNLEVSLRRRGDGAFDVEVTSRDGGCDAGDARALIHCRAIVCEGKSGGTTSSVPLESLREAAVDAVVSAADCYAAFESVGLQYGPSHQTIERLVVVSDGVLADLQGCGSSETDLDSHTVDPGLLDGALHATLALVVDVPTVRAGGSSGVDLRVPFSLDRVEFSRPFTRKMSAWIRPTPGGGAQSGANDGVSIDLFDDRGRLCCRLDGLRSQPLAKTDSVGMWSRWDSVERTCAVASRDDARRLLVTTHTPWYENWIRHPQGYDEILLLSRTEESPAARFMTYAEQIFEIVKRRLQSLSDDAIVIQIVGHLEVDDVTFGGLSGLLASARLENPNITGQVILADDRSPDALSLDLERDARAMGSGLVRYVGERRQQLVWRECSPRKPVVRSWRHGGVYLITGGLGEIGQCFARSIVREVEHAKIILLGRSKLDGSKEAIIASLWRRGATVEYVEADVGDPIDLARVVREVCESHGTIHGVIHSAGVTRDSFVLKKSADELATVLHPKVRGTYGLDLATRELELDFFAVFSSLAAVFGNVGQADYAMANAFMDRFAEHRNELVRKGSRSGHTFTIDWPLWRDGGMRVGAETAAQMHARMGMEPLPSEHGLDWFFRAIEERHEQVLVVAGDVARIRTFLQRELMVAAASTAFGPIEADERAVPQAVEAGDVGFQWVLDRVKQVIGRELGLAKDRIDEYVSFETYGIDSIKMMKLTALLEAQFGTLAKTLFFEHGNVHELSAHLLKTCSSVVPTATTSSATTSSARPTSPLRDPVSSELQAPGVQDRGACVPHSIGPREPVAIIGMSGRYPGALDVDEFWHNLAQGIDSISEVPADRWDWRAYYTDDRSAPGHHYSKWGGFISDADKFDALFFNISHREAELMDPQERIFLEHAWSAVEDAAYTRKTLREQHRGEVGVYAAVMYGEYQLYAAGARVDGHRVGISGNPASIANRVSYALDVNGPSMTVDSMCSGSLTSLQLACNDLRAGNVQMAIAGGVNLTVHPNKYLVLSGAQFISSEGRCASFGRGGSGYVPAEGVGVLILKRLSDAERDGDRILAVIRGSALNHGGRTSGYTVPNPHAQTSVIQRALADANVDPRTISYLEAHGTGTQLGDPIEIAGLVRAFGEGSDRSTCRVGAVKSNIGHCESAAGVAGVTKVVLQLLHRKVVPSLHSQELNPFLEFGNSAFVINQSLTDWEPPVVAGESHPRRAGISSFGAGGSNAHLIIEEYAVTRTPGGDELGRPALFVLSAKTSERLREYTRILLDFVKRLEHTDEPPSLHQIEYSLQIGREAMDHRLGIVARSLVELRQKLEAVVSDGTNGHGVFVGRVQVRPGGLREILGETESATLVESWLSRAEFAKVLRFWVGGAEVDWHRLHKGCTPGRVRLPTYPFARRRHWLQLDAKFEGLHPLIDSNRSTLAQLKFDKHLTRDMFFVRDHRVRGRYILPGVAHLEMALAAGRLAAGRRMNELRAVTWGAPVVLEEAQLDVEIELRPDADGVEFIVSGDASSKSTVYARGRLQHGTPDAARPQPLAIDVSAISNRCSERKSKRELDEAFADLGFDFGPSFAVLQALHVGQGEALGELELAEELRSDQERYILHPSLMDAALRTSLGLVIDAQGDGQGDGQLRVPFSVERVVVFEPLPPRCYVHARLQSTSSGEERRYDFDIVDPSGSPLVQIEGLSARPLQPRAKVVTYRPVWREQALPTNPNSGGLGRSACVLVFDDDDTRHESLCRRYFPDALQVRSGPSFRPIARNRFEVRVDDPDSLRQLFAHLRTNESRVSAFIFVEEQGDEAVKPLMMRMLQRIQVIATEVASEAIRGIYVCRRGEGIRQAAHAAIAGIAKSITTLGRGFALTCVEVDQETDLMEVAAAELLALAPTRHREVSHTNGRRRVGAFERWSPGEVSQQSEPLFDATGTVVITGGAGGLGSIFAEYLVRRGAPKIVLLGRSALTDERTAWLEELRATGCEVDYARCDVTKRASLAVALEDVRERFGRIEGIVHAAGVEGRTPLLSATHEDLLRVLDPKVDGTLLVDELTQSDPLQYFVLFSSLSARVGDFGVASYAAGNRFLDAFAAVRESWRSAGQRSGQTIAIDWPLWEHGGFQVDDSIVSEHAQRMYEQSGLSSLPTASGTEVFEAALNSDCTVLVVAYGIPHKIDSLFAVRSTVPSPSTAEPVRGEENGTVQGLEVQLQSYLQRKISDVSKIPASSIDIHAELDVYGIDSVMIMELNRSLGEEFDELPQTLLFECRSIRALAEYLLAEHGERAQSLFVPGRRETPSQSPTSSERTERIASHWLRAPSSGNVGLEPAADSEREERASNAKVSRDDIAIIGMSGRYPKAKTVEQLWDNLAAGVDAIEEVPAHRWNIDEFYQDAPQPGKTSCKWGGFLDDVECFDAQFFNMTPGQATRADPQLRLMLMTAWETIEDAGYTRANLCHGPARRVGVFIGAMWNEYPLLGGDDGPLLASNASLANQISYHFDVHGPSLVIDTACSSSLYAIELACDSIKSGSCEIALAGGVNLSLHPNKYVGLSQMGFLAKDGRCRSFGAGGSGYVPGEGVGCVLLKPLQRAVADGDRILGVIRASVTNHGGKTHGSTVPNPHAQRDLVRRALDESGLSPSDITYVEAHGTGTELGDPIEIRALSQAFAGREADSRCAIGSIKSNLGHLEGAAGIAAVTKVLLQLQHGQIAPSLHAETLNPNIDFAKAPFFVQRELGDWRRPTWYEDGVAVDGPRVAGISSFGAGGANAHLIISEHVEQKRPSCSSGSKPALIVLSARSRAQLEARVEGLVTHCRRHRPDLLDLAYTLQVGREAMDDRIAVVADSIDELVVRLTRFLEDGMTGDGLHLGHLQLESGRLPSKALSAELAHDVETWIEVGRLAELGELWTRGYAIEWTRLHQGGERRRVSAPTYPFAQQRYWPPKSERATVLPEQRHHEVSEWLDLREEWQDAPLSETVDWNARLTQFAGKRIALVAESEDDVQRLAALIRAVEATCDLAECLHLHLSTTSRVDAKAFEDFLPDVVLFVGPKRGWQARGAWDADSILDVLRLSRALMNAAWDREIEIFYLFEGDPARRRLDCEALVGLVGSAIKENERHVWRTIAQYDPDHAADGHKVLVTEWLGGQGVVGARPLLWEVKYEGGRRLVKSIVEASLPSDVKDPFVMGGKYLIVGGFGYIGERLCERLAREYRAQLHIWSRGRLNEPRRDLCERLRRLGATVHYSSVDVTNPGDMDRAYASVQDDRRPLNGVINLVRAHESKAIINKSEESFERVSRVKIESTYRLDELTADQPLDFFLTFSSLGAHGARGDCDYAYSAAYQSVFASRRNEMRAEGVRSGRAITLCWGPWVSDRLFPKSRARMKEFGFGLIDLDRAWPRIVASIGCENAAISMMLVADRNKVKAGFTGGMAVGSNPDADIVGPQSIERRISIWEEAHRNGLPIVVIASEIEKELGTDGIQALDESLLDRLNRLLEDDTRAGRGPAGNTGKITIPAIREIVAEVLEMHEIDDEQSFQNYGVDSILAMKISTKIERAMSKEVKPQWLIEYPTVRALARHLMNGHAGEM